MNLLKRLRNLWKLSGEIDFIENGNRLAVGDAGFSPLLHLREDEKPRMAQVIKRTDPIAEFLAEEKQNG